jgi:hypothetical protein
MTRRGTATIGWCLALIVAGATVTTAARGQRGRGPQGPPDIAGKWTGTWSSFNPAQATAQPKEMCKQLDAEIVKNGDVWVATFEGDCGRPYKYKISMNGRLSGGVVLFTGTADLGAQDGGVYDWVGRAANNEFIGFYTSAHAAGFFSMTRAK